MSGNMVAASIGDRLENWARCVRPFADRPGSMTGIICESLRKAALGNVWSGHGAERLDYEDAELIERGMYKLISQHRQILKWAYIRNARPEVICRDMKLPQRPISVFTDLFRAAQQSIAELVDMLQ